MLIPPRSSYHWHWKRRNLSRSNRIRQLLRMVVWPRRRRQATRNRWSMAITSALELIDWSRVQWAKPRKKFAHSLSRLVDGSLENELIRLCPSLPRNRQHEKEVVRNTKPTCSCRSPLFSFHFVFLSLCFFVHSLSYIFETNPILDAWACRATSQFGDGSLFDANFFSFHYLS